MSIPTFVPPRNPNMGMGYTIAPRVKTNAYGDGYTQRVGDGVNLQLRSLPLVWGPLSPAEADVIDNFLAARGGTEAFWYQTPRDAANGLPARKFICSSWQRSVTNWNTDQISASFREVPDLGT